MTEDDLKAFMKENAAAMKRAAIEACIAKVKQDIQWRMPDVVQVAVNEFMAEEIAPAVVAALNSERDGIVAATTRAAAEIGDQLAKQMAKTALENLSGYRAKSIIAEIFK
jgi:hypothetical protein